MDILPKFSAVGSSVGDVKGNLFGVRFNESVGNLEIATGKNSDEGSEAFSSIPKDGLIEKKVNEPGDVTETVVLRQKDLAQDKAESITTRVSLPPNTVISDQDGEISRGQVGEEVSGKVEPFKVEEGKSSGGAVSQNKAAPEIMVADPEQRVLVGDRSASPVVAKPATPIKTAKAVESDSAKKTTRPQQPNVSAGTPRLKTFVPNPDASSTLMPVGTSAESAVPGLLGIESSTYQKEFTHTTSGQATAAYSDDVNSAKIHLANYSNGSDGRPPVHETWIDLTSAKVGVSPSHPEAETGKLDTEGPSVSETTIHDTDSKATDASEARWAAIHATPEGISVLSPGAVGTGVIAVGTVEQVGVINGAKLPALDTRGHSTEPLNVSREQGGSGVSSPSFEEVPRMLTATPTSLEVGIQNGTHGWLKVRAEISDGGAINASVSSASSSAQEILHRELPSISAYLEQEKIAVNSLVVQSSGTAAPVDWSASGFGLANDSGGQTSERGAQSEKQLGTADRTPVDGGNVMSNSVGVDGMLPIAIHAGGGWLSVRA